MKEKGPVPARQRPTTWNGLLLGSLLALFVVVFLYVVLQFLNVARTTGADLPSLPALALPQLVRPAPASVIVNGSAPGMPWQLLGQQPPPAQPGFEPRVTILIMGVDARPDENIETTRTDSIMVLTANPGPVPQAFFLCRAICSFMCLP